MQVVTKSESWLNNELKQSINNKMHIFIRYFDDIGGTFSIGIDDIE